MSCPRHSKLFAPELWQQPKSSYRKTNSWEHAGRAFFVYKKAE